MQNNAVLALAMSFSPNSIATATAIPCPSRSPNFPHFSHILQFRSQCSISWRSSSSISLFSSRFTPRFQKFAIMAASVPESAGEAVESADFVHNLRLGAMFGVWYLLNIYYNIFNKQVLILILSFSFSFLHYFSFSDYLSISMNEEHLSFFSFAELTRIELLKLVWLPRNQDQEWENTTLLLLFLVFCIYLFIILKWGWKFIHSFEKPLQGRPFLWSFFS